MRLFSLEKIKRIDVINENWTLDHYRIDTIPKNGFVVDIGANIGAFSILAAMKKCTVLAVEPEPQNAMCLLRNAAHNHVDSFTSLDTRAIWSSSSQISMIAADGNTGWREFINPEERFLDRPGSFIVNTVTLDQLLDPYYHVDFLKIDVEGAEYDSFPTIETQTWEKIDKIAMEFHDGVLPLKEILEPYWTAGVKPSNRSR